MSPLGCQADAVGSRSAMALVTAEKEWEVGRWLIHEISELSLLSIFPIFLM